MKFCKTNTLLLSILAALSFGACAAETGTEGHKDDSFRDPVVKGELPLGTEAKITLEDGARYHAYDFRLVGDASVTLKTKRDNETLDTVMYLYKRKDNGRLGRFIAKNDNQDGRTRFSRIKGDLGAGYYRLLVKAKRTSTRGQFLLESSCTGYGCPAPASNLCLGERLHERQLTETCSTEILSALTQQVDEGTRDTLLVAAPLCETTGLLGNRVDAAVREMLTDGSADWASVMDSEGTISMEVETAYYLSGGELVTLEPDGQLLTYVFDTGYGDKPLAKVDGNADIRFGCGDHDDDDSDVVTIEQKHCVEQAILHAPLTLVSRESGTIDGNPEDVLGQPGFVHAYELLARADGPVDYHVTDYVEGSAHITFEPQNGDDGATYLVVFREDDQIVASVHDHESGMTFPVCESVDY